MHQPDSTFFFLGPRSTVHTCVLGNLILRSLAILYWESVPVKYNIISIKTLAKAPISREIIFWGTHAQRTNT